MMFTIEFVAASAPAMAQTNDQTIALLQHVRKGYEAHSARTGQMHIKGTVFLKQGPAEQGTTIPRAKEIPERELAFEFHRKDNLLRYEQQHDFEEGSVVYALNDGERLLSYAPNAVDIYPLSEGSFRWSLMTSYLGESLMFDQRQGYEDVGRAMASLVKEIQSPSEQRRITSVTVDTQEGLYRIRLDWPNGVDTYWIDSNKGYNLVRREKQYKTPSWSLQRTETHEYALDETGAWVQMASEIKGVENGVAFARRLRVESIRAGDLQLPDEIFDAASLSIPSTTYIEDHHFSPPLVLRPKTIGDMSMVSLAELLEHDLSPEESATVTQNGSVVVKTVGKPEGSPGTKVKAYSQVWVFTIVACVSCLLALLIAVAWCRHKKSVTP